VEKSRIGRLLDRTVRETDLETIAPNRESVSFIRGKVRDILDLGDELLILTTDRISAFDRVLTTIPCKGEVLNRIALYWFGLTSDILPNHVIRQASPRSMLVRKCEILPIEVVVRGYLTGSAWRSYEKGEAVSGYTLDRGMRYNQRFAEPLITPSTKAERGHHDLPISREQILEQGIIEEPIWRRIEESALALYRRGFEMVGERGLILVDTKYEFGMLDGEVILIDEIHTPDSSRYWYRDTYEELYERGEPQRELDKEYLRRWLLERGFSGEGQPPDITDEVRIEMASRYIRAFEEITGELFEPSEMDTTEELKTVRENLDKR
jgi:phosphoribosylaminoimidazole-succinocarboxamide synthase